MNNATNVAVQRARNFKHNDGSMVAPDEWAPRYMAEYAKRIKEAEGGGADPSMLDVGCRVGYTFFPYVEQFPSARIVGVDLVKDFVDLAASEVECHEGDICALPFTDEEFDYVFCSQTLEHAIYPELAASELMRVAGRGIFISVPLQDDLVDDPAHNFHSTDVLTWLALFKHPDWTVVKLDLIVKPEENATDLNFYLQKRAKDELAA